MDLIDNGAPQISLAQAEFEEAARKYQQQAAQATERASYYMMLAASMREIYEDAIRRSMELGD